MTPHTTEVVHPTHQLSVPYLLELRILLTSKCTIHHPLRI
ncbi:hypothetical protein F383_27763 [Gossypium arboreum]|uniref:Uncharacterized protein n=1 Tax=Gossypium arboreum TaxID=29729 RepID=A0A0B0P2A2_GOSAR|nr:hypothetical protein F383_27763 [Gossypium arboreum]